MQGETVARTYAETLFDLARRHDQLEGFGEVVDGLAELLESEPSFRAFLATPRIPVSEKRRVLREALGESLPRPFIPFLLVVLDRGREGLLPIIAREYRKRLDDHLGRVRVDVRLAQPVDEGTERDLAERLSEFLGRTALPEVKVDPTILGGAIFRVGDVVYDGSIRRRLQELRGRLMAAEIE